MNAPTNGRAAGNWRKPCGDRRAIAPNRITRKPRRLVIMRIDRDTLRRIDAECAKAGITRVEVIARAVNATRRALLGADVRAITPNGEEVAA